MLDGRVRTIIDPYLAVLARRLVRYRVTADGVTFAGFLIGLLAAFAIALNAFLLGLLLLLVSRLADGLDGAVAKQTRATDFGGYLDIVLDFVFYGAIPLGFVFADPEANAVPGAVLIFSFYANGASFLAYAIMAEKRRLRTDIRGEKSLYFTTGLAEATETIIVFVLACLFPAWFPVLAFVFAAICFYTAFSRIMLARAVIGEK